MRMQSESLTFPPLPRSKGQFLLRNSSGSWFSYGYDITLVLCYYSVVLVPYTTERRCIRRENVKVSYRVTGEQEMGPAVYH